MTDKPHIFYARDIGKWFCITSLFHLRAKRCAYWSHADSPQQAYAKFMDTYHGRKGK